MPFRQLGFFRSRRLSAGTQDADHAANTGKSPQGVENHSASQAAQDRSGAGRNRTAAQALETSGLVIRRLMQHDDLRRASGGVAAFLAAGLEQEPGAALGFIDESLE